MVKSIYPARNIILDNKFYWICIFCFVLLGGNLLTQYDQGYFLKFFSANRSPSLNQFFIYGTQLGEVSCYLIITLIFLFIRFRYALLIPLTGIIVTIVSFLSKSFFLHPRPSVYYKEMGTLHDIPLVEGVTLLGGLTSFPSGHTMSGFALFTLVAFFFKKKWIGLLCFILALVVGLSRIYLMQHFLKDVFAGALIGVGIATVIYYLQSQYPKDISKWIDRKI